MAEVARGLRTWRLPARSWEGGPGYLPVIER
jgi:hypothetical protein